MSTRADVTRRAAQQALRVELLQAITRASHSRARTPSATTGWLRSARWRLRRHWLKQKKTLASTAENPYHGVTRSRRDRSCSPGKTRRAAGGARRQLPFSALARSRACGNGGRAGERVQDEKAGCVLLGGRAAVSSGYFCGRSQSPFLFEPTPAM